MGHSLTSIPFFSEDIRMDIIESATNPDAFELQGKRIRSAIRDQPSSLSEYDDVKGHYLLTLANGDFIEFRELRNVTDLADNESPAPGELLRIM